MDNFIFEELTLLTRKLEKLYPESIPPASAQFRLVKDKLKPITLIDNQAQVFNSIEEALEYYG